MAFRCSTVVTVSGKQWQTLLDTGCSGRNCINADLVHLLPKTAYHVVRAKPTVCVSINGLPVRTEAIIKQGWSFGGPL